MFSKLKTFISDKDYKKKYGKLSFESRDVAEEMMRMILEQKEHLSGHTLNDSLYWEDFIRKEIMHGKVGTCTLFDKTNALLEEMSQKGLNLKKYDWLQNFFISLENLHHMIRFQIHFSELYEQVDARYEMIIEMRKNEINEKTHPVLLELETLIKENVKHLEGILNPVTQMFYDTRSKPDAMNERMTEKLKEFKEKAMLLTHNTDSSGMNNLTKELESLKQLKSVLKNEDVSEETKNRARLTIQKIESSMDEQELQKRKEYAEMDAEAIIQASLSVHKLN